MLWAIVMAGGGGTRLWPASRKQSPKQFLKLFGKKTLIESTVERISKIIPRTRIFIITDDAHQERTRCLFPFVPYHQIIGEPSSRNTAATIGLGAALIQKKDPKAVLAIFPSDHVILNTSEFRRSVLQAAEWAEKGQHHVVFGIQPTYPATAYGYIERESRALGGSIYKVRRFVEKPPFKEAVCYLKTGRYYWQAGIFVWRVDTILNSFRQYLPEHYSILRTIALAWKDGQKGFSLPRLFSKLRKISIDYGIMEKLRTIYMVPARFDWNDIGSWNAFETIWSKDSRGNASLGSSVFLDSERNLSFSPSGLACFLGVRDLIVVHTRDAVLIASKKHAERVRDLVAHLEKKKLSHHL